MTKLIVNKDGREVDLDHLVDVFRDGVAQYPHHREFLEWAARHELQPEHAQELISRALGDKEVTTPR